MGPATGPAPVDPEGLGLYVYGIVSAGLNGDLDAPTSVDSMHEITLVREGTLAAVASEVAIADFTEAGFRDLAEDPARLEPRIRAHEQVLEAALGATTVVPFRFGTVFGSEDALRLFLADRADELGEALRRVEGKVEIGIKGFLARERFADALAMRDDTVRELRSETSAAEGSGRAYLERRRLEQLVTRAAERFMSETAHEIHNRLLAVADDGLLNPLQSADVSGRSEEMFLNGAYLVGRTETFEPEAGALASEFGERGVTLELTGPWPPYNFVPRRLGEP